MCASSMTACGERHTFGNWRASGGEVVACTASFTPLPAAEGRRPGFAVILCGLTIPADVK